MEGKVYIDCKNLSDASSTIDTECTNIDTNIESINDILDKKINENWVGEDSDAFVQGLKKIMTSLTKYSNEMKNIGGHISDVASDYKGAKDECMKELINNG